MAGEGTKDISVDTQKRTDLKPTDKVLMVHPETGELVHALLSDLLSSAPGDGFTNPPTSSQDFII